MPMQFDSENEIPVFSEICTFCVHEDSTIDGSRCKAFPDGIQFEEAVPEDQQQPIAA